MISQEPCILCDLEVMSSDFRRMFDDAKRLGAGKTHWLEVDESLKEHLVTRAAKRLEIDRQLNGAYKPFLPGVDVPEYLKKAAAQLATEIEDINEVRRDIAREIEIIDERGLES